MTNSASQATHARSFEHSPGLAASIENPAAVGIHTTEGKEPRWFMEQLEQASNLGRLGRGGEKLRINDAQLEFSVYAATASPSAACSPV